jgi:leucyl aminopeptidase
MEFSIKSGHAEKQRSGCIILGVFESRRLSNAAQEIDKASDGYITNLMRRGDIEGKLGQTLLLHNVPQTLSDRVLLVGCGKEKEFGDSEYRKSLQAALKAVDATSASDAVCFLTDISIKSRDIAWKIRQATLATEEFFYQFNTFKTEKNTPKHHLRKLVFNVSTRRELPVGEEALAEGISISKGIMLAKNLANMPPNVCTPTYLSQQAIEIAEKYPELTVSILERNEIEDLNMGAFIAVTKGSVEPPKIICIEYKGTEKQTNPVVLVGKGITFDTGGLSLKPAANMVNMKYDMCGAASVLGTMQNLAELKLPINAVGIMACAENMPSGHATRPDDVVTTMSGITVEINNTDAEGRLVLADALTYAERYSPDVIIDIATLTGACVVALGNHASGLFSNNTTLANDLLNAGTLSGDRAWQLPVWDDYQSKLDSRVADMVNSAGGEAGSITAACFLSRFTKKYRWAHLDIAGSAMPSGKEGLATGRPVPLLTQYLMDYAQRAEKKGK